MDGKIISEHPISDYFARRSFGFVSPDNFETESSINSSVLRAEKMEHMFEALGLPDMSSLRDHRQYAMLKSENHPLGWAVFNQDMGFGRHLIFEIGDDKNHIRLNIKDSWCGDNFKVQIDEITLWDKRMEYSIPCREFYHWVEMVEDILGTIDITTQALCNEDDGQAYKAFQDIERFKGELLKVITPQSMLNQTSSKPTP